MTNEWPQQPVFAVVAQGSMDNLPRRVPSASLARFLRETLLLEQGLVDVIGCFEESAGHLVCVTLWATEADAERYEAQNRSAVEELRWILERDGSGPQALSQ